MTRLGNARPENCQDRALEQITSAALLVSSRDTCTCCASAGVCNLPPAREDASLPALCPSDACSFPLVVRRYKRTSLIVTSSKSFLDWGEVLSDHVLGTAIPHRHLDHTTTLNIKGESYHLKENARRALWGMQSQSRRTRRRWCSRARPWFLWILRPMIKGYFRPVKRRLSDPM
jgi:hypothetical protein